MGHVDDGAAGGLVHAAGLDAHKAVLDHVHAADAVLAAKFVQLHHDLGGRQGFAVHRDRVAVFEGDGDVFGFIRGLLERDGHDMGGFEGFFPRIFKLAAFEAAMEHVAVHAVVLRTGGDRNVVLFGKEVQGGTGHQIPFAPGGDHAQIGREGGGGQLEADLVVALAGRAVGEGVGAFGTGDFHEALGDQRAGHGGAEQVAAFIQSAGAEHGEDEVLGELFAQVFDIGLGRAGPEGFFVHAVQVVFLPHVGGHGDHFAAVVHLKPLEDNGGVQPAGIGEHHFLDVSLLSHEISPMR